MPVEYRKGDLFAAKDLPALAHGCNTAGAMGKGIALEFKRRFPAMYQEYRRRCKAGEFQLGDVFVWEGEPVVFNLATQKYPGSRADLEAIETALTRMVRIAETMAIDRIGLPKIGAGLGKLEWSQVRAVIETVAASTTLTLVVFEL